MARARAKAKAREMAREIEREMATATAKTIALIRLAKAVLHQYLEKAAAMADPRRSFCVMQLSQ